MVHCCRRAMMWRSRRALHPSPTRPPAGVHVCAAHRAAAQPAAPGPGPACGGSAACGAHRAGRGAGARAAGARAGGAGRLHLCAAGTWGRPAAWLPAGVLHCAWPGARCVACCPLPALCLIQPSASCPLPSAAGDPAGAAPAGRVPAAAPAPGGGAEEAQRAPGAGPRAAGAPTWRGSAGGRGRAGGWQGARSAAAHVWRAAVLPPHPSGPPTLPPAPCLPTGPGRRRPSLPAAAQPTQPAPGGGARGARPPLARRPRTPPPQRGWVLPACCHAAPCPDSMRCRPRVALSISAIACLPSRTCSCPGAGGAAAAAAADQACTFSPAINAASGRLLEDSATVPSGGWRAAAAAAPPAACTFRGQRCAAAASHQPPCVRFQPSASLPTTLP